MSRRVPFTIKKGDILTKDGISYLVRCTFRTVRGKNRLIVEPFCMRGFYMIKGETPFIDHIDRSWFRRLLRRLLMTDNPLEKDHQYMFEQGDTVWKHSGDYNAEGVILGQFYPSLSDEPQYVFSFNDPKGLIHIFGEGRLIYPIDHFHNSK